MITNTRTFLRDFAAMKARARKGEAVRVRDRDAEFVFTAATGGKSLIGAARGKIVLHGNLTGPTLASRDWKPSL